MLKAYIVTHGKRYDGANPRMTPEGFAKVASQRSKLPATPSEVVVGTGDRHIEVCDAVDLEPTRYSAVIGGAEALDSVKHDGEDMIVLPGGKMIPYHMDTTEKDLGPSMRALVLGLKDDAVLCSGRLSVIALGLTLEESKSGVVYLVEHDGVQIFTISEV
ncbi:MAG: hypothetical protein A3I07_00465 [Candidatus Doudnabacteria bacterium RIFCSPLOWO2_02_FULL_42_9]|uniref:Phosphoglycerate mutase n=1 Tax=Candidatus Doudnabacteria bacterium RIFCSPHIGHO2_01_FULL_41_86 TaxID=1817821 RepID=A0A1F5N9Z1_9BACT|nr:MAG: hypothetical protein A2717_01790 [Candidatus Doudnabacteria bacterium RIFCSPHIGHO2_01_FULL_41_86]OGE74994.1 MAG: hypothetical protein A3K07_04460 [Candidatus Doudnabacteria bacterium RIFCSPHIGHO2_01_43_10]OGE85299.1 MAG: hypothetical protein A3E28_01360 [Candidatus Doudnabacteria bacterium RIFCSPHIGHO2_12_FULL_42_22]OGE86837.1 MAG: hypothetical protein A3C49_02195 [Candidatus Doudnabacteria bacterium RIFCSPHIGHO2_02_FULL_42_25]OGE92436.1 MAG: hypothetical protein A2895_02350 [Candidatus